MQIIMPLQAHHLVRRALSGKTSSAGSTRCKSSSAGGESGGGGMYYSCTINGSPNCRSCAITSCSVVSTSFVTGVRFNYDRIQGGWTHITNSDIGVGDCWIAKWNSRHQYYCN